MKPTTLDLETSPEGSSVCRGEVSGRRVTGPRVAGHREGRPLRRESRVHRRLKLADDARPGPFQVSLKLSYQACNDRLCQAPAKLEIPLTVTIGK